MTLITFNQAFPTFVGFKNDLTEFGFNKAEQFYNDAILKEIYKLLKREYNVRFSLFESSNKFKNAFFKIFSNITPKYNEQFRNFEQLLLLNKDNLTPQANDEKSDSRTYDNQNKNANSLIRMNQLLVQFVAEFNHLFKNSFDYQNTGEDPIEPDFTDADLPTATIFAGEDKSTADALNFLNTQIGDLSNSQIPAPANDNLVNITNYLFDNSGGSFKTNEKVSDTSIERFSGETGDVTLKTKLKIEDELTGKANVGDSYTKTESDDGRYLKLSGAVYTGNQKRISNLSDPLENQDATTKKWIEDKFTSAPLFDAGSANNFGQETIGSGSFYEFLVAFFNLNVNPENKYEVSTNNEILQLKEVGSIDLTRNVYVDFILPSFWNNIQIGDSGKLIFSFYSTLSDAQNKTNGNDYEIGDLELSTDDNGLSVPTKVISTVAKIANMIGSTSGQFLRIRLKNTGSTQWDVQPQAGTTSNFIILPLGQGEPSINFHETSWLKNPLISYSPTPEPIILPWIINKNFETNTRITADEAQNQFNLKVAGTLIVTVSGSLITSSSDNFNLVLYIGDSDDPADSDLGIVEVKPFTMGEMSHYFSKTLIYRNNESFVNKQIWFFSALGTFDILELDVAVTYLNPAEPVSTINQIKSKYGKKEKRWKKTKSLNFVKNKSKELI